VTAGIVSNTARPVQTGENASSEAVFDAIQTDAAINPGNSGGPLVNLNGDVVGINAAIATDQSNGGLQVPGQQSGNIGIGFAIPSDEASRIAAELIANGKATHAIIGATVAQTASSTSVGAKIQSVVPGGPAAKAGMKAGDVVTQVDTQRIDGPDALVAAIRSHAPHTKVTIAFQRSGNHTVMVTLGEAAS
jgi:putative serine protease PepD